jgi:uncharacterized protein YaeQ
MRWKYLPSMYEKGKLRDFWVGKYIREFRRAYAQKNWPMTWTSLDRLDSETKNAVKCGVMTWGERDEILNYFSYLVPPDDETCWAHTLPEVNRACDAWLAVGKPDEEEKAKGLPEMPPNLTVGQRRHRRRREWKAAIRKAEKKRHRK